MESLDGNVILGIVGAAFSFLTVIATGIFKLLSKTGKATDAAIEANETAARAESNTSAISNGFADRVVGKLEAIDRRTANIEEAFRKHLEWHLDKDVWKG